MVTRSSSIAHDRNTGSASSHPSRAMTALVAFFISAQFFLALSISYAETDRTATLYFRNDAPISITVGEIYPGQTGAVAIGSYSAEILWNEQYESSATLDIDTPAYTSSVEQRTIEDLWHTDAFRTDNGRSPDYRVTYSINNSPYSENQQSEYFYNSDRSSKIRITFTPPRITEDKSDKSYILKAEPAVITFKVTDATASGTYSGSIDTRISAANFKVQ
ncbi:hypothetical protein Plut_1103 [Pelodictyon luteolum DSM 273]|uniref:Uncharacterized protein n=2 Tax=Pelodictyon luteolum TaxID=1100 RepID=Q3B3W6_CHLL3|nr:hypothetical protein Plut_1103 [Pelodictyon luteolum DSM 273]